jgi:hypothetical protein
VTAVGCERESPLGRFEPCVLGAIASVRHGDRTVEVDCPVPAGRLLVGMPAGNVSIDDMTAAGLSRDVAEALRPTLSQSTSIWCAREEYEQPATIPEGTDIDIPVARTDCVSTDMQIPGVVQTRSAQVHLRLVQSESGRAFLDEFEPQ